jgi:hypothetical protein
VQRAARRRSARWRNGGGARRHRRRTAGQHDDVPGDLETGGPEVAGVQVDIAFAPQTPIRPSATNRPVCTVNPASTEAGRRSPSNLRAARRAISCTAIRALILPLDNVDPIPDGSLLFTCTVDVSGGAALGNYPLLTSNAGCRPHRRRRAGDHCDRRVDHGRRARTDAHCNHAAGAAGIADPQPREAAR